MCIVQTPQNLVLIKRSKLCKWILSEYRCFNSNVIMLVKMVCFKQQHCWAQICQSTLNNILLVKCPFI